MALQTSAAHAVLAEGETTEVTARVRNTKAEGIPMTVAVIGLPGGVEARVEKLQELVKVRWRPSGLCCVIIECCFCVFFLDVCVSHGRMPLACVAKFFL